MLTQAGQDALDRAFNQTLPFAREIVEKMKEVSNSKGLETPEKVDPTCGLEVVFHELRLVFRDFSPQNLLDAAQLYGIPSDAEWNFYKNDDPEQIVQVEWSEAL